MAREPSLITTVVAAKAGTHNHRSSLFTISRPRCDVHPPQRMGPSVRRDDTLERAENRRCRLGARPQFAIDAGAARLTLQFCWIGGPNGFSATQKPRACEINFANPFNAIGAFSPDPKNKSISFFQKL